MFSGLNDLLFENIDKEVEIAHFSMCWNHNRRS